MAVVRLGLTFDSIRFSLKGLLNHCNRGANINHCIVGPDA